MADKTRWGILATGNIAKQFARGLAALEDAELAAVGSRSGVSAAAFGDEFGVPHRHASYEALARDKDVDVIYVATPHPLHKENTLLCLDAGKAVLCEKPFAINAAESEEMIACAREKNLFLMEAMWTHFFPAMARVRELIAAGAIGEVRMLQADFGFRCPWDPKRRLLDPALGGGGLLDVGVYVVSLAQMVFGKEPERVTGLAHIGETGIDEQAALALGYAGGGLASLTCGVQTQTPHTATIMGTEGMIQIPQHFWRPERISLHTPAEDTEMTFKLAGNGYNYQAAEVGRCLREGRLESAVMPHEKTLAVMRTLDRLREQWGLKYPME